MHALCVCVDVHAHMYDCVRASKHACAARSDHMSLISFDFLGFPLISLDFLALGLQKETINSKRISTGIGTFGWSKKGGLRSLGRTPIGEASFLWISYGF